jgi:hypothetical protein
MNPTTHPARGRPACLALLGAACLLLAACGGGGSSPDAPQDAPAPLVQDKTVLVRPAPGEDIAAIVASVDVAGEVVRRIHGTDFYLVRLSSGTSVEAFLARLEGDARVLEREPDRVVSAPEGGGATIPVGSDLFDFSVVADQPELVRIGAPIARTRATGLGVRIAVIDSGVVAGHVLLAGHIEPGGWDYVAGDPDPTDEPNGLDDDQDGLVDEGFGHGTFASSLILAVAPDVSILPYRVLNSDSTGLASHVAEAIVAATDAGVHAINLSLGMEHRNAVVGQAVLYARDAGVLVFASAGNTGQHEITYPAAMAFAEAVTAVDGADVKAPFASYGDNVDLAAPGVALLGAWPVAPDTAVAWSGTSFSAALVSGAYALVRELHPTWLPLQITAHLESTSDPTLLVVNPTLAGQLGQGRLDLDAATAPTK